MASAQSRASRIPFVGHPSESALSVEPRTVVLYDTRQSSKRSQRKRRGRPRRSHILRMPLEIISLILACLLPQDLLSMSRLSKAFRRVLLYRPTALPLWRNALRLKSGASRIPAGMNEVQLAHLVYGSDCQFCGSRRHVVACYAAHVRLCGKCARNRFIPYNDLPTSVKLKISSFYNRSGILPYVEDAVSGQTLFCSQTGAKYAQELDDITQNNDVPMTDWFAANRRKIQSDLEFVNYCKAARARGLAEECQDKRKRKQCRSAEILKRLEQVGWQEEVFKNPNALFGASFLRNKAVKTVKPLSDKQWTKLRGMAVAHMKKARAARLERERIAVIEALNKSLASAYADFRRAQPFRALVPAVGDMAKAPVVQRLYEQLSDAPPSPDAVHAALASVSPTFTDRWRAHCEDLLLSVVREQGGPALTRGTLGLATTVFALCGTDKLLTYPHILCEPALDVPLGARPGLGGWDPRGRVAVIACAGLVRQMVALAGRDPHATTALEMDALDPWYYYPDEDRAGKRRAYTWRGMLKLGARWRGQPFAMLGPWETGAARARAGVASFSGSDGQCARCQARFSGSAALCAHLYQSHGVVRPTRADVVLDYGLMSSAPTVGVLLTLLVDSL
ncbi:hypothetical protein FB107DRAFT_224212 [Schizophyllum commune]